MDKIPKKIHYCWFGKNQKPDLVLKCIESWKKYCTDWEFIEWNEENFDVNSNPFTKKMYANKKWAFVSDYVRLNALEKFGGFYLDTDMLLLKSLNNFLNYDLVLGRESDEIISSGMIGVIKEHQYISICKDYYNNHPDIVETIPRIMTALHEKINHIDNEIILPPKTFYPFDANNIKKYQGQDLGNDVYGVHLWNYSWGHPLNRFFKKIGIHSFGKKITEILGIKKILKKMLGFE